MTYEEMIKNKEVWKDIPNYDGYYQVSSFGRVKSLSKTINTCYNSRKVTNERIMSLSIDKMGYPSVRLCKDGSGKTIRVHRLVALAFIPNPDNKKYIDHIDTIRTNNYVTNLRWATPKENANNCISIAKHRERMKSEAVREKMSKSKEGVLNPMFGVRGIKNHKFGKKMTHEAIEKLKLSVKRRKVYQMDLSGNVIAYFNSTLDAEKKTGVRHGNISKCCDGKAPTAGGYIWRDKI